MTHDEFERITGHAPENDDLERANCPERGLGHDSCGTCEHCGHPRFIPNFNDKVLICNHRTVLQQP